MLVDHETVVAYLNRVGVTEPTVGDAAGLRMLHRAHLLTVPFENLSIHLGEPISLDERDLTDKIVRRRRGGFCYELNGAFALLLEGLGAQVSRVAARVYEKAGLGPPFDHLALIVRPADGSGPWLADVGFGSHSDYPLLLEDRDDQDDPAGRFRLAEADAGDIDVLKDGKPQYRIETRERSLADFVPTCWWQQTSPLSHFTQSTICSRLTPGGRVSISGRMLIQTQGGIRTEQQLDTDDALLAAYQDHFGIAPSRVPDDPAARAMSVAASDSPGSNDRPPKRVLQFPGKGPLPMIPQAKGGENSPCPQRQFTESRPEEFRCGSVGFDGTPTLPKLYGAISMSAVRGSRPLLWRTSDAAYRGTDRRCEPWFREAGDGDNRPGDLGHWAAGSWPGGAAAEAAASTTSVGQILRKLAWILRDYNKP
jgi:N-hydroxyarylamine O-acetyltransferase